MKGGYLQDKYINGCDIGNGYTFYQWSNIDIFVYFSHHFVTIPPPGWVNVAHRNNVKILGTVITEGDIGINICKEILEYEDTWQDFGKSLVNICVLNAFDGWLLNIENRISNTEPLIKFVSFLTTELRKVNPEYIVLWYDSVIKSGKLKWQNELNISNKCFFDVCDGIFLNYTWKDTNLEWSAKMAQHRILDVFVGVDVFGRNCFGGGGFNSHAAASLIRRYGLSMAIFAPGWTHETLTLGTKDNFFDMYCRRDTGFWLNLYPYLYTHPVTKSFTTTFHLGSDEKSYNLNNQELVPSRPVHCGTNNVFRDQLVEKCDCIQLYNEGSTVLKNVDGKDGNLNTIILTRDGVGRNYSYRLLSENQPIDYNNQFDLLPMTNNDPMSPLIKKFINFGKVDDDWTIRYYFLSLPLPMSIMEIGTMVMGDSILVGGFSAQADFYVTE
ncbi:Endo-beta-N-acetylglucosaminidase [Carabus blaptoides fortunei]